MTYTYDDIVTAKDILTGKVKKEDIIGKKGWLLDCIPQDMSLNVIERIGLHTCLDGIDLDSGYPFGNCDSPYTYFLPEKEKPYVERQAEWIKENNIKIGDKVRILRKVEGYKDGWMCSWVLSMDETVGEVCPVIKDRGCDGIEVRTNHGTWCYPYSILKKVEDEPEDAKPQFKVGDKVRIVKEWGGFTEGSKPTIGETGVIEEAGDACIRVRLDSDNDWWLYSYDAVEPIKDESAYIPFDLSDPKDRDFLRGKWVRSKNPDVFNEFEIAHFVRINNTNQDIKVETSNGISYFAGELLYDYEFLDGSHVGRRKEEA